MSAPKSRIDTGGLLDEIASLLDWELPENGQQWLAALANYAQPREATPEPMPNWQQLIGEPEPPT